MNRPMNTVPAEWLPGQEETPQVESGLFLVLSWVLPAHALLFFFGLGFVYLFQEEYASAGVAAVLMFIATVFTVIGLDRCAKRERE